MIFRLFQQDSAEIAALQSDHQKLCQLWEKGALTIDPTGQAAALSRHTSGSTLPHSNSVLETNSSASLTDAQAISRRLGTICDKLKHLKNVKYGGGLRAALRDPVQGPGLTPAALQQEMTFLSRLPPGSRNNSSLVSPQVCVET